MFAKINTRVVGVEVPSRTPLKFKNTSYCISFYIGIFNSSKIGNFFPEMKFKYYLYEVHIAY